MTDFFSAEESDNVSIAPSPALPYPQHHPNITTEKQFEVEYEAAQQLIQHSQGRREDGGGASVVHPDKERSSSVKPVMAVTSPKEDENPASNGNSNGNINGNSLQPSEYMRASSSQERPPESQYPPVSIPPAKGQMCR